MGIFHLHAIYKKNSFQESAVCGMINQPKNFPLIEFSFAFFFVLPLIIIFIQYMKMSSSIAHSEKPLDGIGGSINGNRMRRRAQSNKSIIRMLRKLLSLLLFRFAWSLHIKRTNRF